MKTLNPWPNHALQRPAIASRLQSHALVGRVAELGSLGRRAMDILHTLILHDPAGHSHCRARMVGGAKNHSVGMWPRITPILIRLPNEHTSSPIREPFASASSNGLTMRCSERRLSSLVVFIVVGPASLSLGR